MAIDFSQMKELSEEASKKAEKAKEEFIQRARAKGLSEEKINEIIEVVHKRAKEFSTSVTADLMEYIKERKGEVK